MISDKLSKRENAVMGAVYTVSGGKERFLVSPYELLALLPPRAKYDEAALERALRALELDGYFTFIATERKGERAYVVHMKEAGLSFRRSGARERRTLLFRIALTLFCGVLSALVGVVIKLLLS